MADSYGDNTPERDPGSVAPRSRWRAADRGRGGLVAAVRARCMCTMTIIWPWLALGVSSRDISFRKKADKPVPAEAAESALVYLKDLLSETREELSRVDNKASLLLAAVGVVLGALIGGLAGSRWTPMSLNGAVQWLWWLGVASAATGILSIAAAVYPRIYPRSTPEPGAPVYYGHVSAYRDIGEFRQALDRLPSMRDRLVNQTFVLSGIVQRKYALLRRGLWCLLLTIVACALAVVVSALLGS
jgi:pycsar effector protein